MKHLFSYTLLLFVYFNSNAQSWAPTGAIWYYSYNNFSVEGYVEIKYTGDSLVAGQMCKVLDKKSYTFDYATITYDTLNLGLEFTYLDSNIIYYYRYNQFFALYDFNAQSGDWWTVAGWDPDPFGVCDSTGKIQVDSTGIMIINSDTLSYLKVSPKDTSDWQLGSTIVERIGSMGYMFPEPTYCILDVYEGGPLRCYQDSIFGLYQTGVYPNKGCDYISSIKEKKIDEFNIAIYPNPNTGQFTLEINLQNNTHLSVNLYKIDGRLLLNKDLTGFGFGSAHPPNLTGLSQKIELSKYAKGIYYVQVVTDNDVFTRKVIYQ